MIRQDDHDDEDGGGGVKTSVSAVIRIRKEKELRK
jgi:hypothetical protein